MNGWSKAQTIERVDACRRGCEAAGIPFHADALAAALGVSYEQLARQAAGEGVSPTVARTLAGALQECTAAVVSFAMGKDAKYHPLIMWYLRNRAGFTDKGETAAPTGTAVTFVGENKI